MAAPLAKHERNYVISLLALGNTKKQVIEKLEKKYGRRINPITITRIKKEPKSIRAINDAQEALIGPRTELLGGALLKQKAYKLIDKKLTRAEQDDTAIDELRAKLQAGDMTRKEFDLEVQRYEVLTVNELVKIADAAHQHSRQDGDETPLTPQDQAAFAMLMQGIQNGNAIQLVQVLNPQLHQTSVYPNVKSPEPSADTQE